MENLNQQYQKLSPPQFLMKALLMQLLQPIRDRTCLNKSNHTDTQLNTQLLDQNLLMPVTTINSIGKNMS